VKVINVKKNGGNQELDIMMGQKIDFASSSPPASRPSYSGTGTSGTPSMSNSGHGGDVARLISKIVAYDRAQDLGCNLAALDATPAPTDPAANFA